MGTLCCGGRPSVIEISGSILAVSNMDFMPFFFFVGIILCKCEIPGSHQALELTLAWIVGE
jgi:hypothetical protein